LSVLLHSSLGDLSLLSQPLDSSKSLLLGSSDGKKSSSISSLAHESSLSEKCCSLSGVTYSLGSESPLFSKLLKSEGSLHSNESCLSDSLELGFLSESELSSLVDLCSSDGSESSSSSSSFNVSGSSDGIHSQFLVVDSLGSESSKVCLSSDLCSSLGRLLSSNSESSQPHGSSLSCLASDEGDSSVVGKSEGSCSLSSGSLTLESCSFEG